MAYNFTKAVYYKVGFHYIKVTICLCTHTFLASSFSKKVLYVPSSKSVISFTNTYICAFSMSLAPASPVCMCVCRGHMYVHVHLVCIHVWKVYCTTIYCLIILICTLARNGKKQTMQYGVVNCTPVVRVPQEKYTTIVAYYQWTGGAYVVTWVVKTNRSYLLVTEN